MDGSKPFTEVAIYTAQLEQTTFLLVPPGYAVQDLEYLLATPTRSKGDTTLHDVDSFISFVKQETTNSTRIYCNLEAANFLAVFNDNFMDQPGWRDHTASFTCVKSEIDQARASIEEGTGLPILNGTV